MDQTHFSVCFEGNLRSIEANPFTIRSPFGRPETIGYGNVFDERDELQETVDRLQATLRRIAATAGHPNAAEECRLIVKLVSAALEDGEDK